MQKIWREHQEWILAAFAISLLAIIGLMYVWGIGRIVTGIERAIRIDKAPAGEVEFNLDGAKKILDNRGITP